MPFVVTARTILQLGAELISSDAIAFYELIKNAFDARSKRVRVSVVVRMPYPTYRKLARFAKNNGKLPEDGESLSLEQAQAEAVKETDLSAPFSRDFRNSITESSDWASFYMVLREANYIDIIDTGEGMNRHELLSHFLVIGTQHRLRKTSYKSDMTGLQTDINKERTRPVLGEKGIGRLSVMRLGDGLRLETSKAGEHETNVLDIDWSIFDTEEDVSISEIMVEPTSGQIKDDPNKSGTKIHITALKTDWTVGLLAEVVKSQFAKLTDPFTPGDTFPIVVRFNGKAIPIPEISELLFQHAHAVLTGEYRVGRGVEPQLVGHIEFRQLASEATFEYDLTALLSITNLDTPSLLYSLGPFTFKLYWYNRRILNAIEGIGDIKAVRDLIKEWSGGFMIFRDGFRVFPYGGPDDDWLDIDRAAFGASGYKVNRTQLIGAVRISRADNPNLVDQTNREGFLATDEREVFRQLLMKTVEHFRVYLTKREEEFNRVVREPATFDELEQRVRSEERVLEENFSLLLSKYPIINDDRPLGACPKLSGKLVGAC